MEKRRSVEVTFFGVLFIVFFTLSTIKHIFLLKAGPEFTIVEKIFGVSRISKDFIFSASVILRAISLILIIFIYISPLISGIGILKLKNWARRLALSVSVVWVFILTHRLFWEATQDMNYYRLHPVSSIKQFIINKWPIQGTIFLLLFLFFGGRVYYFTRLKVKEQFK